MFRFQPILCNYYITTRCNAACGFCDIHRRAGLDAGTEDVLKNLAGLRKTPVRFIDFTGGEPLLHPDLPAILREAKRLGFLTTVTTNCILYPQRAIELAGLVDFLHFSLDSPIPEVHDRLRGKKCHHQVMESISIAKELGEKPDLLFTLNRENASSLEVLAIWASNRRLILIVNPVFSYFGNEGADCALIRKALSAASMPNVYVNRGILRFMLAGGNRIERPRCRAVTTTVVVSTDGRLLLPCFHHPVLSLKIDCIDKLIYSESNRRIERMQGRYSFCQGCGIGCYFDASFTASPDRYFFLSQLSKLKYALEKKDSIPRGTHLLRRK